MAVNHEIYVYLDNKDRLAAASYEIELDTGNILDKNFSDNMQEFFLQYVNGVDANSISEIIAGLPAESCTISAEIIFHGKDYLPSRYEGSFLIAFDNGYSCEASYTGENRTDTKDMQHSVLNTVLKLSNADTSVRYDIAYEGSYQTEDNNLAAELTVTDENHTKLLSIVSDSTLSLEDDTIEFALDKLTLTVNTGSGEAGITLDAEVSFSPLTDRIPLPEGKERNMLTMSTQDYEQFFDEVLNGLPWF